MRLRTLAGTTMAMLVTGGAAVMPASGQSGAHAAAGHTVVLKNIRFNPATIRIKRGDTVTWMWRDGSTQHNVTGSSFKSRTMSKGSFRVRFAHAGTFSYRCTIHASLGMRGKIVVR